jgi:hypothetical protein
MVELMSPPITTVASGFCTSAPALVANAIGRNPKEATAAVISTGRKRICVPFRTTSIKSETPSFRSLLNSAISTIPFNTATPNKAMNPTPAEILNGIPLISNAKTPPMAAIGIAVKINTACLTEWKVKNKSMKINNKAAGTAMDNLA